jgi:hypothetical protein
MNVFGASIAWTAWLMMILLSQHPDLCVADQNRQKTGTMKVATTKNHSNKGSPSFQ